VRAQLLCVAVWLLPVLVSAAAPQELVAEGHVRMRVSTEPARQVVLGQQTRIFVEILTDTWFTKAPLYPELSLAGAIALMPEQLGTNFTERIDGTTFAAQRRSYVVYPQRAGTLDVPPIAIRLGVAVDAKPSDLFTLTTPPLKLQVVLPPAAEGVERFVTTPKLAVEETWDRPLDALHVGDAVRRTVRLTADDSLGMLLPALGFEAPSGVALYRDQPRATDRVNRGQYRGERVEAATYVLQRAGEFVLPELQVHWWNTRTHALETEILAARTLEVAVSESAEALELPPVPHEVDWRALLGRALDGVRAHGVALLTTGIAVALAGAGLRRRGPAALARLRRTLRERRESEAARFRELDRDARRGDADAVVRSYWRWRTRLETDLPGLDPARLRATAEASGFRPVWARFERARYAAGDGGWDRAALRRSLSAFRAALRATARPDTPGAGGLNPRGPVRERAPR
jgi:hypothetical protein